MKTIEYQVNGFKIKGYIGYHDQAWHVMADDKWTLISFFDEGDAIAWATQH